MRDGSGFGNESDQELGEWISDIFAGPHPQAFTARLEGTLATLPSRRSAWDELAAWAGPKVLVAAAAAGLVLGLSLWNEWRHRVADPGIGAPSMSVALIEPRSEPILYAILEER